ncbi:MAG TPA: cytochrome c oxidase subunit II [Steroidobacteraceae bacterium]|nr:cytochrome c oxidase subunit II [Steroidobacteraceae bacterium]
MSTPRFLLPQASSIAFRIDVFFWSMTALCALVAAGVIVAIVFFGVRYRRGSPAPRTDRHRDALGVEITWILVPFGLFVVAFIWSLSIFALARTPPANARDIYVVAKQWMWKIEHPGGQREINTLHVPVDEPVRLTMTSQDVIHSFYVPAFRVKQDVLPGRYTQLWFTATQPGTFPLLCTQYCGTDHARMGGTVIVMPRAEYARWLAGQGGAGTLAAQGAQLFRAHGCSGCHGSHAVVHAPELTGLYGRMVHLADGRSVLADDRYLRDCILEPSAQRVAGYPPVMPSFSGELSEEELLALIAYMKSGPAGVADESADERR